MSRLVEEWRPIQGYEGLYEVSDWGRVRSLDRFIINSLGRKYFYKGRILKISYTPYASVSLGKGDHSNIHLLVAKAFLPIPQELQHLIGTRKLVVGHLKTLDDGTEDKTANEAWNIRWMSQEENLNYGTARERLSKAKTNGKRSKEVYQYTLDGELVKIWQSLGECNRNGFGKRCVSNCCYGGYFDKSRNKWHKADTYKGYRWSFEPL